MFDSGVICKEKLDASHSQGSKGYADVTRFRANAGQLCLYELVLYGKLQYQKNKHF